MFREEKTMSGVGDDEKSEKEQSLIEKNAIYQTESENRFR